MWHSGQTFFSALLFFAVAAGWTKMFALFTVFAAASAVFRKRTESNSNLPGLLLYTRMALLIVPLALILLHVRFGNPVFAIITLCGIFTDRLLFYDDFKPLNISWYIDEITLKDYEKDRSEKPKDSHLS